MCVCVALGYRRFFGDSRVALVLGVAFDGYLALGGRVYTHCKSQIHHMIPVLFSICESYIPRSREFLLRNIHQAIVTETSGLIWSFSLAIVLGWREWYDTISARLQWSRV